MRDIKRWYTESVYVDEITGEIITKKDINKKKYIIKKSEKETKINGAIGVIKYTYLCSENQTEFNF